MSYLPNSNYTSDGGLTTTIGGTLAISSGATFTNAGTLNNTGAVQTGGTSLPMRATLSAAAGSSNICNVTVTMKAADGSTTVAAPHVFDIWLSDAATGAGLTATTASGTVTAKSASGAVFDTLVAKKALKVQALATGVFILEITDSAKTGFYVCVQMPNGLIQVSSQLVTGNYG